MNWSSYVTTIDIAGELFGLSTLFLGVDFYSRLMWQKIWSCQTGRDNGTGRASSPRQVALPHTIFLRDLNPSCMVSRFRSKNISKDFDCPACSSLDYPCSGSNWFQLASFETMKNTVSKYHYLLSNQKRKTRIWSYISTSCKQNWTRRAKNLTTEKALKTRTPNNRICISMHLNLHRPKFSQDCQHF